VPFTGLLSGFRSACRCVQGLRQARALEELRICDDGRALREAYAKARTIGRVTEGQLCSMWGSISLPFQKESTLT